MTTRNDRAVRLRRIQLAGALSLITVGSAMAADVTAPPANTVFDPKPLWSGFHVGANVGGAFSKATSHFRFNYGPVFGVAPNTISGPVAGLGGGYDWQSGGLVIGAVADFQWADANGKKAALCPDRLCSATYRQELLWFGNVRGRLGYASGDWLAYVTGGYAYAKLETTANARASIGAASTNWNELKGGWVLGGGVEVMFAPGWSASIEGLHLRFGATNKSWMPTPESVILETGHLRANLVRAGINYRF